MAGVDNRIVTMQFNNRSFEQNARQTMSTLGKLKEGLNFGQIVGSSVRALSTITNALSKIGLKTPFKPLIDGANRGLGVIGTAFERFSGRNPFTGAAKGANDLQRAAQSAGGPAGMGVLEGGVTAVSSKFIALSTIAITALSNITNRAINAGAAFAKSFTIQPVLDGLNEYQTTLQSMQTIQANTDKPLRVIEQSLQDLNTYSDLTIYNFGEMAKNVGTFTAAGVNLKDSVSSIKGIANVAALSGSSSQQAAGAMYQLSQAIAAGKVGAQDWNSVVNAGMAGKKLQTALAQTAVAMGAINKNAITADKATGALKINGESFKNSIMAKPGQESWLSSGVLVNTLAALDGRFSKAYQLSLLNADGTKKYTAEQVKNNMALARTNLEKKNGVKYTDAQFKALQQMSDKASSAAQDVKTLGQVFDIAKETIGSGWSASFVNIFGNLKQSKRLFTDMSNGLGDIIRKNALARNTLLKAWSGSELGGRATLIAGLKNAWKALLGILGPIKQGFRDIFPAKTVDDLKSMTLRFALFTQQLVPSKKTMADIRDISGGVAAALHIVVQVVGGVIAGLKTMFSVVGGGKGDFLDLAAGLGENVKRFDAFLEKSGIITTFFETLGKILAVPLALLRGLGDVVKGIFGGFDEGAAEKMGNAVEGIGKRLSGLEVVGQRIRNFFLRVGDIFGNLGSIIAESLVGVGDTVAKAFTPETFGRTLDVINTTLLGGIVLLLKNFFTKGVNIDMTGGLFDGIKQTLGEATGALQNMQKTLKADILLKIAAAIGVMALALLVLSGIDPKALAKAMAAMTGGFAILIGAMATLMKVMGPAGLVQLYVVTSAMTKMAFSILLLALALKMLASVNFGDMLRGLFGLAVMMKILSKVMPILAANSKGMGRASASLILLGIALNIMAVALKVFASMSWAEMLKGMVGLAGTLVILAGALKIMPDMKAEGIGLVLLAVAMNILAVALKIFATMSLKDMAKALFVLAASLGIIATAIDGMPKTMMLQAAALLVVANALVVLGGALKIMASMGWKEIGRGLTVLGASMLILAVGLRAIGAVGTAGAVGLLIAASALAIFAPVMLALGAMKWESILKSLAMLAGIFTILGVAAVVLGPLVPVILGLAAALVLLGAGIALMGVGALALATAFTMVVAAGSAGMQILVGFIGAIIAAIPPAMVAVARGIVGFAATIGQGAGTIAVAMGRVMNAMLDQVLKAVPKIGRLMLALVNMAITVAVRSIPRLADAGMRMIIGLISAAARNVGKIVTVVTSLVVNFMRALGNNAPRLADAGAKMIIKFVNALSRAIDRNSKELGQAGARLGISMIKGMASGLSGAAGVIKDAAVAAAKKAFQAVKDFFHIKSPSRLMRDEVGKQLSRGMAEGIRADAGLVSNEAVAMGSSAFNALQTAMANISDELNISADMTPTISPVLDLTALTKEANKMSKILAAAPIIPTISYQTAADISSMTQGPGDGPDGPDGKGGGDVKVELTQILQSPKPIDSVEAYRGGKTLIAQAKEALKV